MSKNRNRAKLSKAKLSREYNSILKNDGVYCPICVRRGGGYNFSCHPGASNKKGWRYRENRTWKHNRKTQWRE